MNIDDICFFDTETRAYDDVEGDDGDVTKAGTYRYAKNSFVIMLTYCIGNGPVQLVENRDMDPEFFRSWENIPTDLYHFAYGIAAHDAPRWFAAWNTGFDRQAFANSLPADFPVNPEAYLDVMAQAVASNLPPSLEGASRFIGRGGKQEDGKKLIKLFCSPNGATPQSHPEEWRRFCSYGVRDAAELREVFRHTRPLPLSEWEEYWASERINDRGMMVDVEFCRKAAHVAQVDAERTNQMLVRLTNGQIRTVMQHQKIAEWVFDQLVYSEARELLVAEWDEEGDGTDGDLVAGKLSLERDRVTKLITFFEAREKAEGALCERDETILKVLQLREFGASAAPKKFDTMLRQHDEGALRGGYVWNGAAQTGRFSAKGVQVHNMTRSVIGKKGAYEAAAIEMINDLEV